MPGHVPRTRFGGLLMRPVDDAVMVADGNSARRDRDHNASLYIVYRTFGDMRSAQEILALNPSLTLCRETIEWSHATDDPDG